MSCKYVQSIWGSFRIITYLSMLILKLQIIKCVDHDTHIIGFRHILHLLLYIRCPKTWAFLRPNNKSNNDDDIILNLFLGACNLSKLSLRYFFSLNVYVQQQVYFSVQKTVVTKNLGNNVLDSPWRAIYLYQSIVHHPKIFSVLYTNIEPGKEESQWQCII